MALIPNSTTNSLKDKQIESIERMLNFNKSRDAKDTWDEPWKLLIYDTFSRDLISPLMRVGDLRKHGVTLHMLLHSDRQQIPDVPAIYFVSPTKENIKRIIEDFKHKLYDSYHLNFTSSIPRELLEELANAALEYDVVSQVAKVFDQYLNFVSLEKDLFNLMMPKSFIGFNDPNLTDTEATHNIEQVVEALFSVLVTMGVVPIIRCPRNGAAESVATQLDSRLQEHLNNVGNLFAEGSTSFQRPVLVLLDRNIDVTTMVHHTWNYQPLVQDLLGMNLNKVSIEVSESEDTSKQMKQYDLDANTDPFWASNMDTPFPKIAVEVKSHLTDYQNAMEEFKKISGGADLDTYDESQILGRTKELGAFVSNIPILKEKKRLIDMHTNIATAILNEIKSRELDTYFSMEEDMISRLPQDKKEVLALLSDSKRGTTEDKVRLLLVYFLNNENLEVKEFLEVLQSQNIDTSSITWAIKTKAFNKALSPVMTPQSNSNSSTLRGFMQKVNVDSLGFGGGISKQLSTLLTAGVKALLPPSKELYVTRIVDSLMELKPDPSVENYLYMDPKVQKKMRGKDMPRKSTPYKEAIVFVIGGGNYVEYQNLQEYAKKVPGKRIVYGSTEILNASQFLTQIGTLGAKYNQK